MLSLAQLNGIACLHAHIDFILRIRYIAKGARLHSPNYKAAFVSLLTIVHGTTSGLAAMRHGCTRYARRSIPLHYYLFSLSIHFCSLSANLEKFPEDSRADLSTWIVRGAAYNQLIGSGLRLKASVLKKIIKQVVYADACLR